MDKKPFGLMGLLANLWRRITAKKDDCQCDYDEDDESEDCGDDFPADYEEEERYEEGSPSEEWYNFYSQER